MRGITLFLTLSLIGAVPATAANLKADDFRIAYETFLANGDLEEAYQLAQRISTANPKDLQWQRRLARASDWSNRPSEAYKAWKVLYRSKDRDKEVMKAIRRLANYFNDAPVQLELLQSQIKAGKRLTPADADNLITLYERSYRATEGARYLEQLYHRYRFPFLGKKAAELYGRAGHDEQSLRMYRALNKQNPADRENLLTAVKLEIRLGHYKESLQRLKTYYSYAQDDDFAYWQTLGDMAWMLQDNKTATSAYSHLSLSPQATEEERIRTFELLLQENPLRAADIAVRFYHAGAPAIWLQRALGIYVDRSEWRAASQILTLANNKDQRRLQQDPRYLVLRSQVTAHFNKTALAAQDMLHAIALDPESDELLISALWLFSDIGDRVKLQQLVKELPQSPPPAYWHVLAVSYQELGSQARALEYYRLLLQRTPQDAALQLEYAELLQRNGNAAEATRIRHTLWRQLHSSDTNNAENRITLARLLLTEQPGDLAAQRVRQLLHNDPTMPKISQQQRDELLLSWAIEAGWRESARNWVARRYTSSGEPLPKWASLHLALEAHDHTALQTLLAEGGNNLSADSAYDAAMLLGRWPLARKLAFEGLQQSPSNHDLHQRLIEVNEQHGDRFNASLITAHYDSLDISSYRLSINQAFSETMYFGLGWQSAQQSLNNRDTLQALPEHDDRLTLYANWQSSEQQQWQLEATNHDELNHYTGWKLDLQRQYDRRLQWNTTLSAKQPVDYTAPLQIAAHMDQFSLGLDYVPERHFRIGLNATSERYHTQYDAYLGSGTRFNWEAGYWLRENYPDWSIRLAGDHYLFNADGEPDARSLALLDPDTVAATTTDQQAGLFIPIDDNYYALCTGAGSALRDTPTRTLRPFTDLCAIHSDNYGDSYSLVAGVAGSLTGRDHLSLTLEQSNSAMQANNRNTQIFTLNYQHIF